MRSLHLEGFIQLLQMYPNKTFSRGLLLLPVTRGGVLDGFGVKTKPSTLQSWFPPRILDGENRARFFCRHHNTP
jgi:hypothetical protein